MPPNVKMFSYKNPITGNWEQRPLEPGFWQKMKEGVVDTEAVDKAREAAQLRERLNNHSIEAILREDEAKK